MLRVPRARYGANALAGLIKIDSAIRNRASCRRRRWRAKTAVGRRREGGRTAATGGTTSPGASWRSASIDGFRRNDFSRARTRTGGGDDPARQASVRCLRRLAHRPRWHARRLDNGYDALRRTIRSRHTPTDPGATHRIAGRPLTATRSRALRLISTSAYADSDIDYSFDGTGATNRTGASRAVRLRTSYERRRRTPSEELRR